MSVKLTLSLQEHIRYWISDMRFRSVAASQRMSNMPRSSALQNHKSKAQNFEGLHVPG